MNLPELIKNAESMPEYIEAKKIVQQSNDNMPLYFYLFTTIIGTQTFDMLETLLNPIPIPITYKIGFFIFMFFIFLSIYHYSKNRFNNLLKESSFNDEKYVFDVLDFKNILIQPQEHNELLKDYVLYSSPAIISFINNSPKNTLHDFLSIEKGVKLLRNIEFIINDRKNDDPKKLKLPHDYKNIKLKSSDFKLLELSDPYNETALNLIKNGTKKIKANKLVDIILSKNI